MFQSSVLNQAAKRLVNNIYNNFMTHQEYVGYSISCQEHLDCMVIDLTKEGRNINMYRFYPDFIGDLGSISIYGIALESHYSTIKNSGKIFGLEISDIELVTTGTIESFVDVTL